MAEEFTLSPEVTRVLPEVVETRRDIHAHPELGFQEHRTAALVAERLRSLGMDVREGVGRTGVVGLLKGGKPGNTVMLRADMDALPVQEANTVPYASTVPGVMHACGHDGHTAMLLGAARVLAAQREHLAGAVKFVFQPAEESYGGARYMVEDGVLTDPDVAVAFGLHLWNSLPLGAVAASAGPCMAATDILHITIQGSGGHAAAPHEAVDPVVMAAQFLVAAQTLASRSTDPVQPIVLTFGMIHAGDAVNIIPEEVKLGGTLRTLEPEVRANALRRIEDLLKGITAAYGGRYVLEHTPGYPALRNDAAIASLAREEAAAIVGAEQVVTPPPAMGGEDMAYYFQEVPGCYLWVGSANAGADLDYPHHNPRFNFDERALSIGVELLVRLARRYLAGGPGAG